MANVLIPSVLRKFTGGLSSVEIISVNVMSVIQELITRYPGIQEKILDSSGNILVYMNVFVDNTDIRDLDGVTTKVDNQAIISLIPAIVGG